MSSNTNNFAARLTRLRGINLNLLLVFDTLYRERNLTMAANSMHLTQPALSHSLKKLRELLDDPLFVRGPEGMEPTPLATQMQTAIDRGLYHFDQALTHRELFVAEHSSREFRIGICDDAVNDILHPSMLSYALKHAPNLCFHWIPVRIASEEQAKTAIENGNLDAVIVQLDSLPLQLPHDHLFDDPIGCIGDQRHHGEGATLPLAAFVQTPQVALSHREDSPLLINETLRQHGLSRRIVAKTTQIAPLATMLSGTELLAVITASAARMLRYDRHLRFYRLPLAVKPFRVCLITDQRRPKDPGIAWLRHRILSHADTVKLKQPGLITEPCRD